jgi:hypothetical protein
MSAIWPLGQTCVGSFDAEILGKQLSDRLRDIYFNRTGRQFFVALQDNDVSASFNLDWERLPTKLPDSGFQILTFFRLWNDIEYWYPYRDILSEHWDDALRDLLPKSALAADKGQYRLALSETLFKLHDSNTQLVEPSGTQVALESSIDNCVVPIQVRFAGGFYVVE